jgi:hypothetical protein
MKWQRGEKGHFITKGTDWVHSMDGHDKMMGCQNSTFPLAIYGPIDTASRKILWLKIWTSNSCPKRIGSRYLEHLHETCQIASMITVDKGTETGMMVTMHSYLRQSHGDMNAEDTVLYGPSTSNQVLPQYINRVNNMVETTDQSYIKGIILFNVPLWSDIEVPTPPQKLRNFCLTPKKKCKDQRCRQSLLNKRSEY